MWFGFCCLFFLIHTHLQQSKELPDTCPKAEYLKVSVPAFASEGKAKFFSGRTCLHSAKRCDCSWNQAWVHAAAWRSAPGYVSVYVPRVWFLTSPFELHAVADCAVYRCLNWLHGSSLSCVHTARLQHRCARLGFRRSDTSWRVDPLSLGSGNSSCLRC